MRVEGAAPCRGRLVAAGLCKGDQLTATPPKKPKKKTKKKKVALDVDVEEGLGFCHRSPSCSPGGTARLLPGAVGSLTGDGARAVGAAVIDAEARRCRSPVERRPHDSSKWRIETPGCQAETAAGSSDPKLAPRLSGRLTHPRPPLHRLLTPHPARH